VPACAARLGVRVRRKGWGAVAVNPSGQSIHCSASSFMAQSWFCCHPSLKPFKLLVGYGVLRTRRCLSAVCVCCCVPDIVLTSCRRHSSSQVLLTDAHMCGGGGGVELLGEGGTANAQVASVRGTMTIQLCLYLGGWAFLQG
jgi:hypothetical protein